MELKNRLELRAKAGLSNKDEVTPQLLDLALKEAYEIVDKREVSSAVKLDIAYYRLMLMLKKQGVDDIDLESYKEALKIVKNSPIYDLNTGNITIANYIKVNKKENKWQ